MTIKNPEFIVMYKLPLAVSLTVWVFGWMILWNIFSSGGPLPKNSPGPWFDVLFWVSGVLANGLLGPLFTIKYSLSIHVWENRLSVRRYFGLFSNSYNLSDISTVELSPSNAKVPKLKIAFVNGDRLTVSGYASQFQELCSVLGASLNDGATTSQR